MPQRPASDTHPKAPAFPYVAHGNLIWMGQNPPGRPPSLALTLRDTPDGRVTVLDSIIDTVRNGGFLSDAAAKAGVRRASVHEWLREGARVAVQVERARAAGMPDPVLSESQRLSLELSERMAVADAELRAEAHELLVRAARAVTKVTETVRRDAAGQVIERVTKKEVSTGSLHALTWLLERRFPDLYGPRMVVHEVPVFDPSADRRESLAELIAALPEMVDGG